ncbi:LysR family transcriptional regulator [Photobacterium profundum]|uniref:Transcriptional regulators, LysR family protein n=1 Tax=Photobacterium profundum 3TCK TaxID=314280 RepID=Q1YXP8_9GAMM|nr:LysR family transcriptional regulator [Photobacterium profundum]EAS41093.1 transcriptional regulators, LysR family protein [Photobacterium profundum 3TCK]PSV62221.1 LysR family transcriptional regulator [Photobacterium profundum]
MKDLFYSLDLNLLRTFLVLSQELNMRKASERLYVSQPAISQALQRLRNHFGDELFLKSINGLKPTPYAEDLAERITPFLDGLAHALNTQDTFNPLELNRTIKIALPAQVLCTLSGTLVQHLKEAAPNADLHILNWSSTTLEEIAKDTIHLGINYDYPSAPKEVSTKKLITLEGAVIVRKDHPIKLLEATPIDFSGYEIASMLIPGWNDRNSYSAEILAKLGIPHKVGFRSEFPMALIDVIQHTDMYLPNSTNFPIHQYPNLRMIKIKIDEGILPTSLTLYSYTHQRNRKSELNNWLHTLMFELLTAQKALHT